MNFSQETTFDCSRVNFDYDLSIRYCEMLKTMHLIRAVEFKLAAERKNGVIGGPVHLGVGQEAVAVGVSNCLNSADMVFGAHRSHSHVLALGASVRKLFSEILGRSTGLSKGMGGSMHLWDGDVGFHGSVPIVSGTVPIAVGAGLAAKMQGKNNEGVAYLGDGAMEEGVVHESMNLARILNIPVLFIVENNLYASHMHISQRQPSNFTSRFAAANNIPYRVVDGNDVLEVYEATNELLNAMRVNAGPAFIEAFTYRWFGHVDWREDIDVGVSRSHDEIQGWRKKDPIERLKATLIKNSMWSEDQSYQYEEVLNNKITADWDAALMDPQPTADSLLSLVYKHVN